MKRSCRAEIQTVLYFLPEYATVDILVAFLDLSSKSLSKLKKHGYQIFSISRESACINLNSAVFL